MLALDLHQHLWPDDVLRTLEGRSEFPRATWRGGSWQVRLRHEPPFAIDPVDHDPVRRGEELAATGVDRALVSLSSPVGLESVPGAVAAWSAAASTFPASLGWWAAVPLAAPAEEQIAVFRDAIGDGAAGLCLSASALRSIGHAESALPLLHEVSTQGVALFVHPGEADGEIDDPAWWSPTTSYVNQMQVAWHAFHAAVRPALSELRVVFALLAGLAPLHMERTVGRGGALDEATADLRSFYDTSSYGPNAIRWMTERLGSGQFVHGTDHPVARAGADPVAAVLGAVTAGLVRRENPARALGTAWIPA